LERRADRGQGGDLLVDLSDLGFGASCETGFGSAVVAMGAGVEQFGDLVKGEAEALCGLDHLEQGDGFLGVDPVTAQRALGWLKQTAALVVTQVCKFTPTARATCPAR